MQSMTLYMQNMSNNMQRSSYFAYIMLYILSNLTYFMLSNFAYFAYWMLYSAYYRTYLAYSLSYTAYFLSYSVHFLSYYAYYLVYFLLYCAYFFVIFCIFSSTSSADSISVLKPLLLRRILSRCCWIVLYDCRCVTPAMCVVVHIWLQMCVDRHQFAIKHGGHFHSSDSIFPETMFKVFLADVHDDLIE